MDSINNDGNLMFTATYTTPSGTIFSARVPSECLDDFNANAVPTVITITDADGQMISVNMDYYSFVTLIKTMGKLVTESRWG